MLFIFDTHPIQYRTPLFKALSRRLNLRIFYFEETFRSKRFWMHERDKIPPQKWGIELTHELPIQFLNAPHLFSFYKKTKLILETDRPSWILIFGYFLPENWILLYLAKQNRIKVAFLGETLPRTSSPLRNLLKKNVLPLFFRNIDRIITIGEKSYSFFKPFSVAKNKFIFTKYAVDASFFQSKPCDKNQLRERNHLPNLFTLLFVGRLFERKRPLDIIYLHRELVQRGFSVQTLIIGNGELEEKVRSAVTQTSDCYYLGFKNQIEIKEYYQLADLLVVPSEYETWGLVVNEAMCLGLPALVTDTCGVAHDLVKPNQTGFVYSMGNLVEAADAIQDFIKNPSLRETMALAARKEATENYSVEKMASEIASGLSIDAPK